MLRAGLVRQTARASTPGCRSGFRVLKKIEQIVREEQDRAGRDRDADADDPVGRAVARERAATTPTGPEMLRIRDRHDREMLFGPTNEEMITALFRDDVKELPRPAAHALPHPVEVPRRGPPPLRRDARARVPDEGRLQLRSRRGGRRQSYYIQMLAYLRTFKRLGSKRCQMRAANGPIGGDLSHEFIVLAPTGEAKSSTTPRFEEMEGDAQGSATTMPRAWRRCSSRSRHLSCHDETHDKERWARCPGIGSARTGDRSRPHLLLRRPLSRKMNLKVIRAGRSRTLSPTWELRIWVTPLVGAIIEASHDEADHLAEALRLGSG
jgi:prolyl-tRNA synthetase